MLNTASFLVIVVVVVLSLAMTCLFHSYVFRWVVISFWVQFFCGFPIVKHVGPNCIATVLWINAFCSIFALFRSSTCQCINKWIVVGCMCLDWSEKIWFCFQSVNICEMKKKQKNLTWLRKVDRTLNFHIRDDKIFRYCFAKASIFNGSIQTDVFRNLEALIIENCSARM